MHSRVSIVTGATSGIGLLTAEALARRGDRVWILGRDEKRTREAADHIQAFTGNPPEALVGDLSSLAEVRRLADSLRSKLDRIDVLVNNAGAAFPKRALSADGIEMTFALNHFGHFLLTNRLIDLLEAGRPARVVNVASDAHRMARKVDEANLKGEAGYAGWRSYAQSKLANILFSNELARRLEGRGVTSNALHPGFVRTRFFQKEGLGAQVTKLAAGLFAIPPEQGAKTSIYAAISPEVEGITGAYFEKGRRSRTTKAAQDPGAAARLWDLSTSWTA
ncbi:MAG: SDR family oxidoreductase [Isosphaeraceae bacterium]